MVVHLGIILIAVALAASNSYSRAGEFTVTKGETVEFDVAPGRKGEEAHNVRPA